MRIHVSYLHGARLRDHEKAYVPLVREELRRHGGRFALELEEEPARADLLIIWEGLDACSPEYIRQLERDPLIREHAGRVYTISHCDHPAGFLAGLYTSLEAPFYDPAIHRIWPFLQMNNSRVYELRPDELEPAKPEWLFSFTGALSHPLRQRLCDLYRGPSPEYHVEHVDRWFNHGEREQDHFLKVALDSVFCLCPRGYTSYTHRIAEVMSMARVPVIIADDWIPFSFEEDLPYCIRVPERDMERLPEILRERRATAGELRKNARALWEKYCAPERRVPSIAGAIARLAARPGPQLTYQDYRERWHSKTLMANLGWTARQRLALKIERRVRHWLPGARIPGVSDIMRNRNRKAHA